jgi:hypothetical protein
MAALQVDSTPDPATGVVRLQLSNGIKVNYRRTDNEPQAAMIRMVAAGGRACEGAPAAGTRASSALAALCCCTSATHGVCDKHRS